MNGSAMESTSTPTDRSWYITERWQQFEGEARANQLRIIAIGSFYLIHLWNHFTHRSTINFTS